MEIEMDYYFKTEKLSVGYQNTPLIEDITIGIRKGEILTLIGPNGAGKSTILKSIARQLELISGVVYLSGNNMAELSGAALSQKMAVVFTEKLQSEMMSCEDVVATGRYPYTGYFGILAKEDHAAVEEAMELVHITEIKDCDFTKISDGQRQRVMLARAICQEPEIIILDEPTSYLDIKYKLEFLSTLQELRNKKKLTVIMSLHELELAERVSDYILCVRGKYIDRFGEPEEVFEPGYIRKLFQIETGSYDEKAGSMELQAVKGKPEVFVIAGNGTGKNVFRRLQRKRIPFAAGILFENDLDYPTAKALAAEVIAGKAFEPVSPDLLQKAKEIMDTCREVICCRTVFGSLEQENEQLCSYARTACKHIFYADTCRSLASS